MHTYIYIYIYIYCILFETCSRFPEVQALAWTDLELAGGPFEVCVPMCYVVNNDCYAEMNIRKYTSIQVPLKYACQCEIKLCRCKEKEGTQH